MTKGDMDATEPAGRGLKEGGTLPPALLALLEAAFERWPASETPVPAIDHLRWKMGDGDPSRRHVVIEHRRVLVGACIEIPMRVNVRDRELRAVHSTDVAVHPGYRGRGLAGAIVHAARPSWAERFDLQIGGFARHAAMRRLQLTDGRTPLGNRLCVFRRHGAGSPQPVAGGVAIRAVDCVDERFDDFWRAASAPFDLIQVRDRRFIETRYLDPRAGDFSVRLAEADGSIAGFAVVGSQRPKGRGQIVDLLVLPGRPDIARALVSHALEGFERAGVQAADCWLSKQHPYTPLIMELGFALEREQRLRYRALRASPALLSFLGGPDAAVHLTMGDTDAF